MSKQSTNSPIPPAGGAGRGGTSAAASTNVELLFEPTGDLEKDYCAYCEIEDKNDRDDIIEGILREELDTYAMPITAGGSPNNNNNADHYGSGSGDNSPHSYYSAGPNSPNLASSIGAGASSPIGGGQQQQQVQVPIVRTTLNLRNLAYCLNKRDMQPLADAIPHCPSLTAVKMTGCGLTEHSYKQLVEAVYKSGSVHTLAVDMNPDGLFKDPTVTRRDRNEVNVYAHEYRGAHMRPAEEKEGDGAAAGGGPQGAGVANKRAVPPKPSRPPAVTSSSSPAALKKSAAQQAAQEGADRVPIPLPTGWHAALLTGVQVLSLRGNGITDAMLQPLCDLLATNTELMSLSLWGNRITSAGAAMMAKALAQNNKLVTLNLGHNQIDDGGVRELMGAFLTRDVPYDEMCRLRSRAHSLLAATLEAGKALPAPVVGGSNAASLAAAAAAASSPSPPPAEPPLFPAYGDITAAALGKKVEEGTIATIKAYGIPISTLTGQAPAQKKKEGPVGGKKKGSGEGPIERPTDPYDKDVIRLYEDPVASPATTALIAQQLGVAAGSGSAAAVAAAITQAQQLSKFRVPGNTSLMALNLSFNPEITAAGIQYAASVLQTRDPTPDDLFAKLQQTSVGMEFSVPAAVAASSNSPSSANKGAPPTPCGALFGAPIAAAIPTLAGHAGLTAPAANASVLAAQLQTAILSAPHLHCLNSIPHAMAASCPLRQLDMEPSKADGSGALKALQAAMADRRAFILARKAAGEE